MAEIADVLSRLEMIFNATELNYVIVGGIAVIHYGHIRTTQDIDIIIEDDLPKIRQFIGLLRINDFDVIEDQFSLAYEENSNISIFDDRSFLRLDLKVARNNHELDVLKNAKSETILEKKLKIASLEHVLIGKIIYLGQIDDISDAELLEFQDIIDFLTIYQANKEKINSNVIRKKLEQEDLKKTFERLIAFEF